jgi:hypothetical protein
MDHLTNNDITKMFDLIKDVDNVTLDHGDVFYTVWVSYSEIYNESIYDLLVTCLPKQKRTPLKLSLDQDKNVYVRGMSIYVFTSKCIEKYAMKIYFILIVS